MRKILLMICVLGIPCASWAQTNRVSWANLSALQEGQKIQIVEMNGKKHFGTFVNISDTVISYQETTGEHAIQEQDVRSVKLRENKHRFRNTLIGLGVGTGVGAGIGAATFHSCSSQSFCIQTHWSRRIGWDRRDTRCCSGRRVGAVVGAALPSHRMIYSEIECSGKLSANANEALS